MVRPTDSAESLWFLNTLVTIRVGAAEGTDGVSILEHRAPHGDSPPLHVHQTEDEIFHVLEGEVRMKMGDDEEVLGPGEMLLAPKGAPHTYRVDSAEGARWLTITSRGDFERFVRTLSRPPERLELPPPSGPPTPEQMNGLVQVARAHQIDIVGPPLSEPA